MAASFSFTLNGKPVTVDNADPHTPLSQWLRRAGHTGTKEGCAEGDCGACTVLVSDLDHEGAPVWRAVNSCIAFLPSMAGRDVVTVEGLADGAALHPVQKAMIQHGGSQCGYCTPGFVMSMAEGCARHDLAADSAALCGQLDGNLCRCTGYRPIRDAMMDALRARDQGELVGIGKKEARTPEAPTLSTVDVERGDLGRRYLRPTSLGELLRLRAAHPEARLVAGATEVGVELRKRLAPLPFLLDTTGVAVLKTITTSAEAWTVGGGATLTALDEALAAGPVTEVSAGIRKMLRVFASRPIRNRATLAGNIATASPIGDMPPVLLALDATVVCASVHGEREVPIGEFFLGYRKTALAAHELVKAVVIPRHPRSRFDVAKVSKRKDLDISIVASAFRFDLDDTGAVISARLAYGGVAATPVRATQAEALLVGKRLEPAACAEVLQALATAFSPIDDVRASQAYRRGLVSSLLARFLDEQTSANPSEVDDDPAFREELPWQPAARSRALSHDSAHGHVTGDARYVDDTAQRRPMLELWPVLSSHAHGTVLRRDATKARAMPGITAVLFAEDIPGDNDVGAIRKDEVLLAKDEVMFHGHPIAIVVGDTLENCRRAAREVIVEVEPLPALLGIDEAVAANSFHSEPHVIARGNALAAMERAPQRLSGELRIGGQEHFYLESQAAWAERLEDDEMQVWSSTQHPSEIQAAVSHVLHLPRNKIVVTSPRMGGGFGGKETQGNTWAALAALAAWHTRQPVRVQLDRDVDMQVTGKRHPFLGRFDVGFDHDGRILALDVKLISDGGWALDLSESINDRALFHVDNAYFFENIRIEGRVAKTHNVSHTAFRGFGGPQGMLLTEDVLGRVAGHLGLAADVVRARNFYAPPAATSSPASPVQLTPYGQPVDDHRINAMWKDLSEDAELAARRQAIETFNTSSPHIKRGLAVTPVKFGISFTASFLNQAGALVVIYRDGTVQVNHGGTEMGQGLNAKILGIVMRELGVNSDQVRVMRTQTDKVPNTSATAASSGADLNGAAVKQACEILRGRLLPVAAELIGKRCGAEVAPDDVALIHGWARGGSSTAGGAGIQVPFAEVVEAAYMAQISLSTTGFYRTPDLTYDRKAGRGRPFHYFAYGVCAAEVELDGFTGMKRVRRVDILHDVGDSLNPQVDRGQIEGGFVQGLGWLTAEELKWDAATSTTPGRLLTHSASTYQIPTLFDAPPIFRVRLLPDAPQHNVVHGSKAVGEPPLMLAIAVREALRDAVGAFGGGGLVDLPSPCTHEALWMAVQQRRGRR